MALGTKWSLTEGSRCQLSGQWTLVAREPQSIPAINLSLSYQIPPMAAKTILEQSGSLSFQHGEDAGPEPGAEGNNWE